MIIEFEELRLPHCADLCSGRAEFDFDPRWDCIYAESIDLDETEHMDALSLSPQDIGVRLQWFRDMERALIELYADELDQLVTGRRFDQRREWGTYA